MQKLFFFFDKFFHSQVHAAVKGPDIAACNIDNGQVMPFTYLMGLPVRGATCTFPMGVFQIVISDFLNRHVGNSLRV